jgi:hypothetical protein
MINSIVSGDVSAIRHAVLMFIIFYTGVLFAVMVDLFFGIKKARARGVARTSFGFRRTVSKLLEYFGLLILTTIIDLIASIICPLPYFTIIGSIALVFVELKSTYENIHAVNSAIEEVPEAVIDILRNRGSVENLMDILSTLQKSAPPVVPKPADFGNQVFDLDNLAHDEI